MCINSTIAKVASFFGQKKIQNKIEPIDDGIEIEAHKIGKFHIADEGIFDYSLANCKNDWLFLYDNGDKFHFSVGKRDWMPISLAGILAGGNIVDGIGLYRNSIFDRLIIQDKILDSWINANKAAIQSINEIDKIKEYREENEKQFEREMFLRLSGNELAFELKKMWRKANPHIEELYLSTTHERYLLTKHPVIKAAYDAPAMALKQLLEWTADWFESNGFSVNRTEMLVSVAGYEPLIHIEEIDTI
jgi:hypothetical protein